MLSRKQMRTVMKLEASYQDQKKDAAGHLMKDPRKSLIKRKCEHGKGLTDYCQDCGRVNGGGE